MRSGRPEGNGPTVSLSRNSPLVDARPPEWARSKSDMQRWPGMRHSPGGNRIVETKEL